MFLIAVMSCVDPGSGFRNIKDLACLVGEYLQVMSCPMMLPAVQVPGVFPPPTRYERAVKHIQPIRVKVHWLWWGWKHYIKDVQHSINRPGDSGLGRAKDIG